MTNNKKIKIGIPRALLYYEDGVLWKKFFESLGCKVILSPETNGEIINLGVNDIKENICFPIKTYIGHILYLNDLCDYILITKPSKCSKKNALCPIFSELDNIIENKILKTKIIYNKINNSKIDILFIKYLIIGFKFCKNPIKIIYSYLKTRNKQIKYNINISNQEKNKLEKQNKKILIISHFYNTQDYYITKNIKTILEKNNIIPIYSEKLNKKTTLDFSEYFSKPLFLKFSKETFGSLYYCKDMINGIIFISPPSCDIESTINNLAILKNKNIPSLNILLDENTSDKDIEIKLESFINLIKISDNDE